jgi:hypothetical protein
LSSALHCGVTRNHTTNPINIRPATLNDSPALAKIQVESYQHVCGSLLLWLQEGNPAHSFYEKLGGQRFKRKPRANITYFGTELYEVAYGWPNIQTLRLYVATTKGTKMHNEKH